MNKIDFLILNVLFFISYLICKYKTIIIYKKKMLKIVVKGAKEHNLKNVSLEIPKEKLVVITIYLGQENRLGF